MSYFQTKLLAFQVVWKPPHHHSGKFSKYLLRLVNGLRWGLEKLMSCRPCWLLGFQENNFFLLILFFVKRVSLSFFPHKIQQISNGDKKTICSLWILRYSNVVVTKTDDKYTCICKASFAACYQVVALSILVLKSYFFKVPSFLSNIYDCIKTYILIIVTITRDSSRYKVPWKIF